MSGEDRAKILDLAKRKNINIISKHDKNGYVVVDLDRDSLKASMFLSALVTDSSAKFKEINEAAAPSKDEVAYVVGNAPGEPNKFIVYGSKEHAEKSMMKYALKPKKSLAQALFAANDEQGYTHYTIKRGYDAWEPIKRIPAKYLDADKYMVEAEENTPIPIHKGDVFKSLDKSGDFAGEIMYAARVDFGKGKVYVVFKDGAQEWMSVKELNIDKKSIRKYNSETDPDFIGMMG